jgi:hypothetical protein
MYGFAGRVRVLKEMIFMLRAGVQMVSFPATVYPAVFLRGSFHGSVFHGGCGLSSQSCFCFGNIFINMA